MSVGARFLCGLEPLVQEFSNVCDLLVGQAGKRGHAAIRTSGAYVAGQLLPSGVGKDHQGAGEIGSAGASARVVTMAEPALRGEHRFRARNGCLVERPVRARVPPRAERRHVRGRYRGALARVQEAEQKD